MFAVTNKSGCEQGGTVSVSYEAEGVKANGYGLKSGNIYLHTIEKINFSVLK